MHVRSAVLALALLPAGVPAASAAPVFGFNESFPGPGVGSWSAQIPEVSNPGTGGVQGAGDGYLYLRQTGGNLGARCRSCPEYSGDWTAAGITHIGLSLNDVGADEPLEIHVVIGNDDSFWLYNPGFNPPNGQWGRFVVDLTNAANFTRIIDLAPGTFEDALHNVTILQIRHDLAPFVMNPNDIAGDVGIDEITLGDLVTPVTQGSWGRLKTLYRE
jgi:hypothetical protein